MTIKRVMTFSKYERKIRLFRVSWRKVQGDPGYSRQLAISLRPRIFQFVRQFSGWFLTIAGIQLHYKYTDCGCFDR